MTNDNSIYCENWTNAKLMREARKLANLENFGMIDRAGPLNGDTIREATRLYRGSWLNPVLDEIERRFVKKPKK
jgi:hypothetical protein